MRRPGAAAAIALAVTLWSGGLAGAWAGDPVGADLVPDPALSPQQVVRIQLDALRNNDVQDRGIAVAFRFASPENRLSTGPLTRFARMIREGPYALMLSFRDASYDSARVSGDRAAQPVTLIAPGREPVRFVFLLSRQEGEGPLAGCWMTDAVSIEAYRGGQA